VVSFTQSSNVSIVSLHARTHCQILSQLFFSSISSSWVQLDQRYIHELNVIKTYP
jgi:hypothetical protein